MINNGKIIAVNFTPGAGGKFIQNCLGLSKHCVLKKPEWAGWQVFFNFDSTPHQKVLFYQQKLQWALSTVPPDKSHFWKWLAYELRDDQFYNGLLIPSKPRTEEFPNYIHLIAEQNLWVTYSSHDWAGSQCCERYWPVVKYVNVLGFKFASQWGEVKNQNQPPDPDWAKLAQSPNAFNFNLDQVIYDKTKFMQHMSELYNYVGYDDFNEAPVTEYWQAYTKVHQ